MLLNYDSNHDAFEGSVRDLGFVQGGRAEAAANRHGRVEEYMAELVRL